MDEQRQVVVETVQLTKIFRDFWMRPKVKALDSVDLQIYRGEIFGLLGPNGAGKSTLVKILLGLLFPTSGRAAVFKRDVRNIKTKDRIGYMPEESYLYRYLNADETLNFYGRLFNLPPAERRHRVELLLDMVGLSRQRKRPIVEYSKGMARRIGLAQALINDPDLVFLDEPTTGLDPNGTREIKDLILELSRRGKTVFLCSHLLADVEDVCDRIAILYGGRVRRLGSVENLLRLRAMTQITSGKLKSETIDRVRELIRNLEGDQTEITVETPRDRLENFFLRVIEEAHAVQLETAGTTAGTGAAAFFSGIEREEKAERILDELLQAPEIRKAAAEEKAPVVLPAATAEPEPEARAAVLDSLVSTAAEDSEPGPVEKEEPAAAPQQVVTPAGQDTQRDPTTEEVLGGLVGGEGDENSRESSRKDSPETPETE